MKAEAEIEAATLPRSAAQIIIGCPARLGPRRMRMIAAVGAERTTMTIIFMPSEFVDLARANSTKPVERPGA
jgi:hypothetical protein